MLLLVNFVHFRLLWISFLKLWWLHLEIKFYPFSYLFYFPILHIVIGNPYVNYLLLCILVFYNNDFKFLFSFVVVNDGSIHAPSKIIFAICCPLCPFQSPLWKHLSYYVMVFWACYNNEPKFGFWEDGKTKLNSNLMTTIWTLTSCKVLDFFLLLPYSWQPTGNIIVVFVEKVRIVLCSWAIAIFSFV